MDQQRELNGAFRKEVAQVLTEEQRKEIGLNLGREGGKRKPVNARAGEVVPKERGVPRSRCQLQEAQPDHR